MVWASGSRNTWKIWCVREHAGRKRAAESEIGRNIRVNEKEREGTRRKKTEIKLQRSFIECIYSNIVSMHTIGVCVWMYASLYLLFWLKFLFFGWYLAFVICFQCNFYIYLGLRCGAFEWLSTGWDWNAGCNFFQNLLI